MLLYYQFIFSINLALFNVVVCAKGQSSESIVKPLQETDGKSTQFDNFSFKPKIRVFHGDHKIRDFFFLTP